MGEACFPVAKADRVAKRVLACMQRARNLGEYMIISPAIYPNRIIRYKYDAFRLYLILHNLI